MSRSDNTFFDQFMECVKRESERRPGFVSRAALEALLSPAAAMEFVRPKPFHKDESSSATASEDPAATLEKMRIFASGCKRCPLSSTRTNVVFGEGDPHARLMFIGEGPGADEDRLGRPFVGRAGQLLDKMIAAMQFKREEVYIANVVKCRPPGNRTPTPEEAARCIGYLQRQIKFIRPEVIVLLGSTAMTFLLDRREGISRLRGSWLEYEGIPVMPTFHPAYLLRQESAKREAWHDLKMVMAKFGKVPPGTRSTS